LALSRNFADIWRFPRRQSKCDQNGAVGRRSGKGARQ